MTRLIGVRCKLGNEFSQDVLIRPLSYWETCKLTCPPFGGKLKRQIRIYCPGGSSEGSHLFPFRTEKLSPPEAMVLHKGRVARRQDNEFEFILTAATVLLLQSWQPGAPKEDCHIFSLP